jgi:hypothetical protein
MNAKIYSRYFISSIICCLLLQLGVIKTSNAQSGKTPKDSVVFNFKPGEQTWVVPQGITQVHIVANGAQGGGATGGKGGRVTTDLKVTPGQKLVINVGGQPNTSDGGYNGGGKGCGKGFGGGGATDIKIDGTKVLVAGAGGGTGYSGQGGAGGGITGGNGTYEQDKEGYHIAKGGTQDAGGAGARAYFSKAGTEGTGGEGINNRGTCTNDAMGGGGAGYYGGGGSGAGGGGGGSSYTNSSNSNVSHQQGVNEGNGKLVIYW